MCLCPKRAYSFSSKHTVDSKHTAQRKHGGVLASKALFLQWSSIQFNPHAEHVHVHVHVVGFRFVLPISIRVCSCKPSGGVLPEIGLQSKLVGIGTLGDCTRERRDGDSIGQKRE